MRILSYVEGTINFGIKYGGDRNPIPYYKFDHNIDIYCGSSKAVDMVTFADADHTDDPSDLKSVTGIAMMLIGGIVAATNKKQTSVATSTTNAEYVAASEGAKLAIWGEGLISQTKGESQKTVPLLLGDNKACIQLQEAISNTSKIKHVDVAYHHIADEVRRGIIESKWVSGYDMLADGLTKPLPGPSFIKNRLQLISILICRDKGSVEVGQYQVT